MIGLKYKIDYLSISILKKSKSVSLNCTDRQSAEKVFKVLSDNPTQFPYFIYLKDGVRAINISAKKLNHKTQRLKKSVRVPRAKVEESEFVPVLKKLIDHLNKPQPVPEMPNTEKLLKEALVKGFNKLLTSAGNNAELLIRTRDGSSESTVKVSKAEFLKAFED